MRKLNRRTIRDRLVTRTDCDLPAGVGGTVTGGPMQMLDLMEVLNRGAHGVGRGGAVSGAAQVVISTRELNGGDDEVIALSDGSRITFAQVGDARAMRPDHDWSPRAYDPDQRGVDGMT